MHMICPFMPILASSSELTYFFCIIYVAEITAPPFGAPLSAGALGHAPPPLPAATGSILYDWMFHRLTVHRTVQLPHELIYFITGRSVGFKLTQEAISEVAVLYKSDSFHGLAINLAQRLATYTSIL